MYPPLQAAILPAWAGFLDSDGYPPDNGLVSWDVDAIPECPIIVSGSYWVPGWWEEVWVACLRGLCDSRRGRREPTTRREDPRIWRYRIWSTSWH
jgi:hypothetical protein